MPTKPKTFRPAGAPTKQQQRKAHDQRRGTAHQRGYTKEWSKYSKQRLTENPQCVMCKAKGLIVRAKVTDHIKPARYFPELFWEQSNHQSLCTQCNTAKGHEDEARYGK